LYFSGKKVKKKKEEGKGSSKSSANNSRSTSPTPGEIFCVKLKKSYSVLKKVFCVQRGPMVHQMKRQPDLKNVSDLLKMFSIPTLNLLERKLELNFSPQGRSLKVFRMKN